MEMIYGGVLSGNEDVVRLRLIERNTAFSIRYANTIIVRLTSQCSTCRMKGLLSIIFMGPWFIGRLLAIEGLRSITSPLLHVRHCTLPYAGRNSHHRLYP